jgi:hypothetical protein
LEHKHENRKSKTNQVGGGRASNLTHAHLCTSLCDIASRSFAGRSRDMGYVDFHPKNVP